MDDDDTYVWSSQELVSADGADDSKNCHSYTDTPSSYPCIARPSRWKPKSSINTIAAWICGKSAEIQ